MDVTSYLLGKNSSGGGSGSGNNVLVDLSLTRQSGYSIWSVVKKVDMLDTSNIKNFGSFFVSAHSLEDVPILDTSKATNMYAMFQECNSLTDESLDNVLVMCITPTSYPGTRTLANLGFKANKYPAARIQALPHYQAFLDAGWTIGY